MTMKRILQVLAAAAIIGVVIAVIINIPAILSVVGGLLLRLITAVLTPVISAITGVLSWVAGLLLRPIMAILTPVISAVTGILLRIDAFITQTVMVIMGIVLMAALFKIFWSVIKSFFESPKSPQQELIDKLNDIDEHLKNM